MQSCGVARVELKSKQGGRIVGQGQAFGRPVAWALVTCLRILGRSENENVKLIQVRNIVIADRFLIFCAQKHPSPS